MEDKLRQQMGGLSPQNQGRDPFGRSGEGQDTDNGKVEVPDHLNAERAREILDELHHRANDHDRSRPELDYLERLLKQF